MKTTTFSALRRCAMAGAVILLLAATPDRAGATFTLTLSQVGANVVVNGSGTINTTGLSLFGNTSTEATSDPSIGVMIAGPASSTNLTAYNGGGLAGPAAFGSGNIIYAGSGSGNMAGIGGSSPILYVPRNYVSGTSLTDSSTFNGETLAGLGFTPGTYTYTWGTGANADSMVITSVVPEPSTWALLGLGVVGLFGWTLRQRRRA